VVATFYSGMPPGEIERDITTRFERFFTLANGVEHLESRSLPGISMIKVYFHLTCAIAADPRNARKTRYATTSALLVRNDLSLTFPSLYVGSNQHALAFRSIAIAPEFAQLTMDRDLTLGSARDYKEILTEVERTSGADRLMS
jgi:hypothetical protein